MVNSKSKYKYDEELKLYFDDGYTKARFLSELINNAYRLINSVYIFENFDEYCRQLCSDKQEDKLDEYWKASYYEKLLDYVKIIIAFETFSKAMLVKKGILIHKIEHTYFDKSIEKKQRKGEPIKIVDFFKNNFTNIYSKEKMARINGLTSNLSTINFSQTLNENYQSILNYDKELVFHLKEINSKRNRLHFYSDFKDGFKVSSHIKDWEFIKNTSIALIREEKLIIDEELRKLLCSYND